MNTEKMKQVKLLSILIVVHVLASCSSDEPRYADPEAHEKTVQLNEQYGNSWSAHGTAKASATRSVTLSN